MCLGTGSQHESGGQRTTGIGFCVGSKDLTRDIKLLELGGGLSWLPDDTGKIQVPSWGS